MALWKYQGEVWEEHSLRKYLLFESGEYDQDDVLLWATDPVEYLVTDLQMRYGIPPETHADHIPARLTKKTNQEIQEMFKNGG